MDQAEQIFNKVQPYLHFDGKTGLLIGVILSPFLGPLILCLMPFVTLLAAIGAVLVAYGMLGPMKLKPRDFIYALKGAWIKLGVLVATKRNMTVDRMWYETYNRVGPHRNFMYFYEEKLTYSYGDMERDSNRFARFALQHGLKAGDVVALMLKNRPQFVAAWLGFAKVGVRTALINYNLKAEPLLHSFKEAHCKMIVFESSLSDVVDDIRSQLEPALAKTLFAYTGAAGAADSSSGIEFARNLDNTLLAVSDKPVEANKRAVAQGVKMTDPVLFIYTSGTTGNPKAAKITHFRYQLAARGFAIMSGLQESDRVYNPLPLYHSAGCVLGVGMVMYKGAFMALKGKFSARSVGADLRAQQCSVMQYIGEMCRYALAVPMNEEDAECGLRFAIGNGLRPEIWRDFQERFGIGRVCEIYAATEGASALVNFEGREGAVGFHSNLVDKVMKLRICKYNEDTGELERDSKGLCKPCANDEPGELLIEIQTTGGARNFDGYQNAAATAKKVARDVEARGDSFFRSGDLLRRDADGFFYFCDRLGDTFRWKGENVSTNEVSSAVVGTGILTGTLTVYGVSVPNKDGRAGAVAVEQSADDVDFAGLYDALNAKLASYAVPQFIRFADKLATTSTHKLIKTGLVKEGADPANCGNDSLYVIDTSDKTYVPLTRELYSEICSGSRRL